MAIPINFHHYNFESSSLPSVLADPLPSSDVQATTAEDDTEEHNSLVLNMDTQGLPLPNMHATSSQSAEHLNRQPRRRNVRDKAQQRHASRRRGAKRQRIQSGTDLLKTRHVFILCKLKVGTSPPPGTIKIVFNWDNPC